MTNAVDAGADPRACIECGAVSIVSFRSLDGKPRCATCHIAAAEKKRKEDRLK